MPLPMPTIESISTPVLLSCLPDTRLHRVAAMMAQCRCDAVAIEDEDGNVLGVWTEALALRDGMSDPRHRNLAVGTVMGQPVATLAAGTSLRDAARHFYEHDVECAVVMCESGVLALVFMSDILRGCGCSGVSGQRRLDSLPLPPPVWLDGETGLAAALTVMREQGRDAVLVGREGEAPGLLTRRDAVRLTAEGRTLAIRHACSSPLCCLSGDATLEQAREALLGQAIRHLGLVDAGGELRALIGFGDVVSGLEQAIECEFDKVTAERDRALAELRSLRQLGRQIFDASGEGIMVTDANGVILSVNAAFSHISGYSASEAIGATPALIKSGRYSPDFYRRLWHELATRGEWSGEMINRHKNGTLFTEHLHVTTVRNDDGSVRYHVAVFSDITERKRAEARLDYLFRHDALTGLPNRRALADAVRVAITGATSRQRTLAVLHLNLDRFKRINEMLGRHAGDALLGAAGRALETAMSGSGLVAHLTGDEFGILLHDADSPEGLAQAALDAMSSASLIAEHGVYLSASVGIAVYPDDGAEAELLLANAEAAMRKAKAGGKNTCRFYSADAHVREREQIRIEYDLYRALAAHELEVWYQPKVELVSGHICGAEALIRWRHPELGLVSPEAFIPVAEDSSLIVSVGEWVLREACRQSLDWRQRLLLGGRIAVNISGRHFRFGGIVETVAAVLAESGLSGHELELEVTESVAMEGGGVNDVLQRLRALGVYLTIDDFGTGYSSLSYLKRLPVSAIKIDRAFVRGVHHDRDDSTITRAIIAMARSLDLELVAEGVENRAQCDFLIAAGCRVGQGYYFSPPLTREAFEDRLLEQSARP